MEAAVRRLEVVDQDISRRSGLVTTVYSLLLHIVHYEAWDAVAKMLHREIELAEEPTERAVSLVLGLLGLATALMLAARLRYGPVIATGACLLALAIDALIPKGELICGERVTRGGQLAQDCERVGGGGASVFLAFFALATIAAGFRNDAYQNTFDWTRLPSHITYGLKRLVRDDPRARQRALFVALMGILSFGLVMAPLAVPSLGNIYAAFPVILLVTSIGALATSLHLHDE